MIRRIGVDGASRRPERAVERLARGAKSVAVFVRQHDRQHGPAIGVRRALVEPRAPGPPGLGMLLRGDALGVAETRSSASYGLSCSNGLLRSASLMLCGSTPYASATVETIRGTRSSCSAKMSLGTERPVVGLRPEMRAGRRVDELHRDAQLRARLPEAAFHDVAGADLLADRAHVAACAGVAQRRAARDDAEIREAREPGHDLFGQSFGQRRRGRRCRRVYLNGSTATQKPSSARRLPESDDRGVSMPSEARGRRRRWLLQTRLAQPLHAVRDADRGSNHLPISSCRDRAKSAFCASRSPQRRPGGLGFAELPVAAASSTFVQKNPARWPSRLRRWRRGSSPCGTR